MKYIVPLAILYVLFCVFVMHGAGLICSSNNNGSCEACLKNVSCLWCNSGKRCLDYPTKHVIPTSDDCSLSAARWGVCWLNFEALIISCSIIGGLLLIALTLCICKCCRCCCFKRNRSRYQKEEAQMEAQRQSRKMRQDERRQERKMRNDEIRRKYGLGPSEPQYQKFDNE